MRLQDVVKNYIRNRRAIAELYALDDKSLSDMGLNRAHIRAAVNGRV